MPHIFQASNAFNEEQIIAPAKEIILRTSDKNLSLTLDKLWDKMKEKDEKMWTKMEQINEKMDKLMEKFS